MALGRAVKKEGRPDLVGELDDGPAQGVHRHQLGRGQADGQRDDVGPFGELEEVPQEGVRAVLAVGAEQLPPGERRTVRDPRRGRGPEDRGPAPDVGVHQTGGLELAIGVEHGAAIHPQGGGETALRRQPKTLRQGPTGDHVADPLHDLTIDGRRARAVDGDVQRHPPRNIGGVLFTIWGRYRQGQLPISGRSAQPIQGNTRAN